MRIEAEISVIKRGISPLFKLVNAVYVAETFGHLAVVDKHKFAMHPIIDSLVSFQRLVLSDFVFMVYGYRVDAARVNVKMRAEILPVSW